MATNVGTLRANLTLDMSGFTKGMGKAIAAAQQLGTSLSSALGRKSQSFSAISSSVDGATDSIRNMNSALSELNGQMSQAGGSMSAMMSSMSAANPFTNMETSVQQILQEILSMQTEIQGLNAALGNTNTILQQIMTVLAGNSNFTRAAGQTSNINNNLGNAARNANRTASGVRNTASGARNASNATKKIENNLKTSAFHAKDIKRILEGIVVSQVFYRLLGVMTDLVSQSYQFMCNMEQTQLSFKYLLGDAEAAASMVEKLQDFAIASPLDTSGAADATRYLLNMGFAGKNVVDVLSVITDAAVVSGQDVNETVYSISRALGQMLQSGTASAQEIRQLYNAGVPVAKLLNEQLGLTGEQVKNIGDYAIDSEIVVSAVLAGMQKQFAGASKEMQETVAGAISAIKDSIFVLANNVFSGVFDTFRQKLVDISNAMQQLVTIARRFGPGGVFEALVPDKGWQAIIRNVVGAMQQLGMAIQYWFKIIKTIFGAMGQELLQVMNVILPPISIAANFIMKFAYGLLQACPAIKYFVAALAMLAIAKPVMAVLLWLWKIVGLGGICAKIAGYVLTLTKAIWTLATVHPVITAIAAVIAIILTLTGVTQKCINKIKELIAWLGGKLAKYTKSNKTLNDGLNIGYDPNKILQPIDNSTKKSTADYAGTVNDVADALDDTADSADKAKKSLKNAFNQSFDEVFTINPNESAASNLLGFDPADLDLTPLEDLVADLGELGDFDFDFSGSLDNFMAAWNDMINDIVNWAKEHIGALAIALAGLLAALALGNPWLALVYGLVALFWEDLCEAFGIDVPNEAGIAAAIGSGLGSIIGYLIGGRLGAYIGGAVGLLASTLFSIVFDRIAEYFELGDYSKAASAIGQSVGECVGAAIGFVLGGPVGAAIGAAIGNFAGGLAGIIWGALKEKLGADDMQGISIIGEAIESFLGSGIVGAIETLSLETLLASVAGASVDIGVVVRNGLISGIKGGLLSIVTGFLSTALWSWIGKELDKAEEDMKNSGIGGLVGGIVGTIVGIIITVFTEGAGAMTIPICSSIGTAVGQGLGLFFNDIAAWCGSSWEAVTGWFGDRFTELDTYLSQFNWSNPLSGLADAIMAADFSNIFGNIGSTLGSATGTVVNAIAGFFDNMVNSFQEKAWAFGDWLIYDVPNWFMGLGESIGKALGSAVTAVVNFFGVTLPNKIKSIDFGAICKSIGKGLGNAIGTAIKSIMAVGSFIEECKESIVTFLGNFVLSFLDKIKNTNWKQIGIDILKAIGTTLMDVFIAFPASILTSITTFIYGIFNGFIEGVKGIKWAEIGANILDGIMWIFNAPANIAAAIADGIKNFFEGLWEGICDAFGIHSPAENMKPIGENILNGILEGIKNAIASIASWVNTNIFQPIKNAISNYLTVSNFLTFGQNIITSVYTGIKNAISAVVSWVNTNIYTPLKNAISTYLNLSNFLTCGKNVITSIYDGIKNAIAAVVSWVNTNIYTPIKNAISTYLNLSNFLSFGTNVITSIYNGIKSALSSVVSWVSTNIFTPVKNAISTYFNLSNFTSYGTNVISSLKSGITSALSSITSWVSNNVYTPIKNAISSYFTGTAWNGIGSNVMWGLLNGMKDALANIKDWLKKNIYDKIVNNIKNLFGIESPARKMMPIGEFVSEGFGIGISDGIGGVIKNINGDMKDVMSAFDIGSNPLVAWSNDVWATVNTQITRSIEKIQELVDLTNTGLVMSASMNGLNVSREQLSGYGNGAQSQSFNETALADAMASRLGPMMANIRNAGNDSGDNRRPLYVGTLIADERGLRELDRRMRRVTDTENERRGN